MFGCETSCFERCPVVGNCSFILSGEPIKYSQGEKGVKGHSREACTAPVISDREKRSMIEILVRYAGHSGDQVKSLAMQQPEH